MQHTAAAVIAVCVTQPFLLTKTDVSCCLLPVEKLKSNLHSALSLSHAHTLSLFLCFL